MVIKLTSLPNETISYIFTYLKYTDLTRCSCVCQRFLSLTKNDMLWKTQAKHYFLLKLCESTWKESFIDMYQQFKYEIDCYATIRNAWNKIEEYLDKYVTEDFIQLNGPVSEEELTEAENKLGMPLPPDLRCSLRIHNGQTLEPGPGLFGVALLEIHIISEKILDCKSIVDSMTEVEGCLRLTMCFGSATNRYIVLTEDTGIPKHQIIYTCEPNKQDYFIQASSYTEDLCRLAQIMKDEVYEKWEGIPIIFNYDKECVAVTDDLYTVKVGTYFIPDESSVNRPWFTFAYRITMSMKPDASLSNNCKLETRHWIITDADGHEERVEGPGVVGLYPELVPGRNYTWTSSTAFRTTYGNMKGHFMMRNQESGQLFRIECPCFHMKCLPYGTYEQRQERILLAKKKL